MAGETIVSNPENSNSSASSGWESLSEYGRENPFQAAPRTETTIGSTLHSASESVKTDAARFVAGWQASRAQRQADALAKRQEAKTERIYNLGQTFNETFEKRSDAYDNVASKNETVNTWAQENSDAKTALKDLKSEYSVGNYVRTQAEQVGAILKANSSALKAGLNYFKSKILAKIPIVSIQSPDKIVNQQPQQTPDRKLQFAKDAIKTRQQTKEEYENARERLKNVREGLKTNRQERESGLGEIFQAKGRLAESKRELTKAKAEREQAQQAYESAEKQFSLAEKTFNTVKNELESINDKRETADAKVEEIKKQQEQLEDLANFERALSNRSPRVMRENLNQQLNQLQQDKQNRLEDMLLVLGADNLEQLSDDDQVRVLKRFQSADEKIATIETKLSALDEYEELRKDRMNTMSSHPTVRGGINRAFRSLKNRIVAQFSSSNNIPRENQANVA